MQSGRCEIVKASIGNWPDSEKVVDILKGKRAKLDDRLE